MLNITDTKEKMENGEINSRDEMRAIAKELKVPKWYNKSKEVLKLDILMTINGLLNFNGRKKEEEKEVAETNIINVDAEYGEDEIASKAEENVGGITRVENEENETRTKDSYIDNIEIGMIIAFNIAKGKAMSAKVISIDSENNTFLCKAIDGTPYKVPRCSIIWVKTGKRWPRGIFQKLLAGSAEVVKYAEKAE